MFNVYEHSSLFQQSLSNLNQKTLERLEALSARTLKDNHLDFPGFTCFILIVLGVVGVVVATFGRAVVSKAVHGPELSDFSPIESAAYILGSVILLLHGSHLLFSKYREQKRFAAEISKAVVHVMDNTLRRGDVITSLPKDSKDKV